MTKQEIKKAIENMKIIVDTRERETSAGYQQRINAFPVATERRKLSVGDYSCRTFLHDGRQVDLRDTVVIERKGSLEELIKNLSGKDRMRFLAELERAKANDTRIYILVECPGGWDAALEGRYNSRFGPAQLIGSLMSLEARYGANVHFIEPEHSVELIYTILRYHLKLALEEIPDSATDDAHQQLTPFARELAARYHWTADDLSYYRQCAAQVGVDLESYLETCEEEHQRCRSEEFLQAIAEEEQEEEMEREREEHHRRIMRLRDAYYELRAAGQSTRDLDLAGVWW